MTFFQYLAIRYGSPEAIINNAERLVSQTRLAAFDGLNAGFCEDEEENNEELFIDGEPPSTSGLADCDCDSARGTCQDDGK